MKLARPEKRFPNAPSGGAVRRCRHYSLFGSGIGCHRATPRGLSLLGAAWLRAIRRTRLSTAILCRVLSTTWLSASGWTCLRVKRRHDLAGGRHFGVLGEIGSTGGPLNHRTAWATFSLDVALQLCRRELRIASQQDSSGQQSCNNAANYDQIPLIFCTHQHIPHKTVALIFTPRLNTNKGAPYVYYTISTHTMFTKKWLAHAQLSPRLLGKNHELEGPIFFGRAQCRNARPAESP